MIGILGAMQAEVQALIGNLGNKKSEQIGSLIFYTGRLQGKEVVIAACGIGKVFAAMCAQTMAVKYSPDCIINTGGGGTLTSALSIGDGAVSDNVVQHDMDTSPIGDPKGLLSGINVINISADEKLIALAESIIKEQNINCKKGIIASGDQLIARKVQKDFIISEFSA